MVGGLIVVVGLIASAWFAFGALSVRPTSAPQQAVQEFKIVEAMIGWVIVAIGMCCAHLGDISEALKVRRGAAADRKRGDPTIDGPP
jgi:hypothetical protein